MNLANVVFIDRGLTLKKISDQLHLSRQRLGVLFIDEVGVPFGAYVRLIRLTRTAELLRDSTLLVKEIAAKVGYSTSANLVRDFRALYALSPCEYRAAARKSTEKL